MFRIFHKSFAEMEEKEIEELDIAMYKIRENCKYIKGVIYSARKNKKSIDKNTEEVVKERLQEILILLHGGNKLAKKALKDELEREKQ